MKPTKKRPLRRVEVLRPDPRFVSFDRAQHMLWVATKFHKIKKGDVFRLFDTKNDGTEVPDQTVRGQHVVNVALSDAKKQPLPMLGVVECLPLRGFTTRSR